MSQAARSILSFNRNIIIREKTKRDRDIIFGARAMNAQLPTPLRRLTQDFDIYSNTPKKRADELDRLLDRKALGNYHYVKPAMHPGTFKVMDIGMDNKKGTEDDFGIADYSKPTRKIRTVTANGLRLSHISERAKDARRAIKQPEFAFRKEKDLGDLRRISQSKKLFRWYGW